MCMTMHETSRKDGKLTAVSSGGVVLQRKKREDYYFYLYNYNFL